MIPALTASVPQQPETVLQNIAHEIRQPLGTIGSIAYYLALTLAEDDKHREQLVRVQQLVEQSSWILSNGLGLADTRQAVPESVDLAELITQTISTRHGTLDPPIQCEFAVDLPLARLDPGYGRALIENILGLFRQLATTAYPVHLKAAPVADGIEIQVSTAVPGYRAVASLPPGSALSLDCAHHIAALHGGTFASSIDPASGIQARVMLP